MTLPILLHNGSGEVYIFCDRFNTDSADQYPRLLFRDVSSIRHFMSQFDEAHCRAWCWREILMKYDSTVYHVHRMEEDEVLERVVEMLARQDILCFHQQPKDLPAAGGMDPSQHTRLEQIRKAQERKQSREAHAAAVQSQAAAPARALPPECTMSQLVIGCAHEERSFKLDLLNGQPTRNGQYVFQMISKATGLIGDEADGIDKLKIEYAGSCANGNDDKCPKVELSNNDSYFSYASPIEEGLPSLRGHNPERFREFFKIIDARDLKTAVYQVRTTNCKGRPAPDAIIEVFPDVGWNIDVAFGYSRKHEISYSGADRKYYSKQETKFGLTGELSGHYNQLEWKIGGEQPLFPKLEKFLNDTLPFFEALGEAKESDKSVSDIATVDIRWPSLKLSGGLNNKESSDDYYVYPEGNFKIAFAPLIGADVEINILPILLKAAKTSGGPAGYALAKFIEKCLDYLDEGAGGDDINIKAQLEIKCVIKAAIEGFLEWKWEKPKGDVNPGGEVGGRLEIGIEGKAQAETKVFFVQMAAGVMAGIKSAVGAKLTGAKGDNGEAQFGGELYFEGITAYYSYFYEVKRAEDNPDKKRPKSGPPGVPADSGAVTFELKDQYDEHFVWLEPAKATFPGDDSKNQAMAG